LLPAARGCPRKDGGPEQKQAPKRDQHLLLLLVVVMWVAAAVVVVVVGSAGLAASIESQTIVAELGPPALVRKELLGRAPGK